MTGKLIEATIGNMSDNDDSKVIATLGQMMAKVDQRYDQIIAHVDLKHNDAMTKMDAVYKEVLTVRQEQSIHQTHHEDINDRLDAIEAVPAVGHDLKHKR